MFSDNNYSECKKIWFFMFSIFFLLFYTWICNLYLSNTLHNNINLFSYVINLSQLLVTIFSNLSFYYIPIWPHLFQPTNNIFLLFILSNLFQCRLLTSILPQIFLLYSYQLHIFLFLISENHWKLLDMVHILPKI